MVIVSRWRLSIELPTKGSCVELVVAEGGSQRLLEVLWPKLIARGCQSLLLEHGTGPRQWYLLKFRGRQVESLVT